MSYRGRKVDGEELHAHVEEFVATTKRKRLPPTRDLWDSMMTHRGGISAQQLRHRFRDMRWDDIMALVGAHSRAYTLEVTAANIARACDYYGRDISRREYDAMRESASDKVWVYSSRWLRDNYGPKWSDVIDKMCTL